MPLVLATALMLGGCTAAQPPVTPTETENAGSEVVEQARETGLVAPALPFGGDCAALMSDSEVSELFGAPLALSPVSYDSYAPNYAVELHAGLRCRWAGADGVYSTGVSMVILPEGTVSYDPPSGCVAEDVDLIAPYCALDATANGTTLSGSVWSEPATVESLQTASAAFLALFEERAAASTPAPIPLPAVGAWAKPTDCAAVVAAGDVSGVPGLGAGAVGMEFPFGGHPNTNAAESALVGSNTPFPYCWIDGESADVLFVASGGGRWLESQVTVGATPFTIEGYESAYTSPGQEGLTKVDVFDGPNWLHFQVRYTTNA